MKRECDRERDGKMRREGSLGQGREREYRGRGRRKDVIREEKGGWERERERYGKGEI